MLHDKDWVNNWQENRGLYSNDHAYRFYWDKNINEGENCKKL